MNSSEKKRITPKLDYYTKLDAAEHRFSKNVFDRNYYYVNF